MAFIPATDTVRVELIYLFHSQTCENVHHWQFSSPPSITDMTNLALAHISWWQTHMKPIQPSSLSFQRVKVTDLNGQFNPAFEVQGGLPDQGVGAGDTLPNNCALVIKWLTNLRGRSFRGRTYHFGLQEANVTNNTVSAAHVAQLLAAYTNFLLITMTPQPVPVVASFFTGGAPRSTAILTPIIDLFVEDVIDSQRRRLPGRGA